jgi:hypothetical protein
VGNGLLVGHERMLGTPFDKVKDTMKGIPCAIFV